MGEGELSSVGRRIQPLWELRATGLAVPSPVGREYVFSQVATGRDIALRCPRPRAAGGKAYSQPNLVPRLNGAGTPQRGVLTSLNRYGRERVRVRVVLVLRLLSGTCFCTNPKVDPPREVDSFFGCDSS